MRLHHYRDYSEYCHVQEQGNLRKLDKSWADRPNIYRAAELIRESVPSVKFGLCHGTRRGLEQQWFLECFPGAIILGTEISSSASLFPNTVQLDFHELPQGWMGKADFVYSNSWDHAYDPARAILTWTRELTPGGILVLEHTSSHQEATELDPFGASLREIKSLIPRWTGWRYHVSKVVNTPRKRKHLSHSCFLVITSTKPHRSEAIVKRLLPGSPSIAVEVGVWNGRNAERILDLCPTVNLVLVDRWCPPPAGDSYFQGSIKIARMSPEQFDIAERQARIRLAKFGARVRFVKLHSVEAAEEWTDHYLPMVFLDADHSYPGVVADIKAWWPKIKTGGWIGGHDYDHPQQGEVKRAVLEFFPSSAVELDSNRTWFVRK